MTALIGVLQTGLIVTALNKIFIMNKEESKILRFVDLHSKFCLFQTVLNVLSDVNTKYHDAAARLIQARWRIYKFRNKERKFCSLNFTKLFANWGYCEQIERYNMLNILTQRYNNAWIHWRKEKENKRIADQLFFTEFLTDTPEIARADILDQVEGINEFFGKPYFMIIARLDLTECKC